MIPAAHIVLYLIGTLLGVWAASLVVRGIAVDVAGLRDRLAPRAYVKRPRWLPRDATARDKIKRRIGIVLGLVLVPVAGGVFVAALYVRRWTSGGRIDVTDLSAWKLGAAVLAFFSLSTGVFGWRADPSRGRRRCPKCWYDMSGTAGRLCSECGNQAKAEERLFRTRRSRGLIVAGAILLVGALTLYKTEKVRNDGWLAAVPTTALILGMDWLPANWISGYGYGNQPSIEGALIDRDSWDWQHRWLMGRCVSRVQSSLTSPWVRARAAGLGLSHRVRIEIPEETIEIILRDFTGPDHKVRAAAARSLQFVYSQPEAASTMATKIAELGADKLVAVLYDEDLSVSSYAGTLIAHHGIINGDAAGHLLRRFSDPNTDRYVKGTAIESLAKLASSDPHARELLLQQCAVATPAPLRKRAIFALTHIEDLEDIRMDIEALLRDPDDWVAAAAVVATRHREPRPDWLDAIYRDQIRNRGGDRDAFFHAYENVGIGIADESLIDDIATALRTAPLKTRVGAAEWLANYAPQPWRFETDMRAVLVDPNLDQYGRSDILRALNRTTWEREHPTP